MTTQQIVEVAIAAALIVSAILIYRRRAKADPDHGSQSAVLMLVAGAILLIHGLGLLDYRPSPAEVQQQ
jgi:hypothetical protein